MDDLKPGLTAYVPFVAEHKNTLALDHNPFLAGKRAKPSDAGAGKGRLEVPGTMHNLVWQNRAAAPTADEDALGDALERAFEAGAETPEQVVAMLNDGGSRAPGGGAWTVNSFEAELARLGN